MAFAIFVDEPLEPGAVPSVPVAVADERNAAVAIAGLAAPAGTDTLKHGRFVVTTLTEGRYAETWSRTQEKLNVRGTLKLALDGSALDCWLDPASEKIPGKCATESELRNALRDSAELMARYERAISLPEFQGGLHNGVLFISVNKARLAAIRLDLRDGEPTRALQRWRANQEFLARALAARGTWVDKAILLAVQGLSLTALEKILQSPFPLAMTDYEALQRLLEPRGLQAYDIEGTLREEHAMMRPTYAPPARTAFWVHANFIDNRFYRFSRAFADAAPASLPSLAPAFHRLERDHAAGWTADYLRDPMNTFFVRAVLGGQVKAWQMLRQMHFQEGNKALLHLRLEIHRRGLEDTQIPQLLSSSALRDPWGQPMRWDAAKRALYFPVPGDVPERRQVYL